MEQKKDRNKKDISRSKQNEKEKRQQVTSCELCSNYVYDEEYEYYVCEVNLDEDEMMRFMTSSVRECPYYRCDDEYRIVRKQM